MRRHCTLFACVHFHGTRQPTGSVFGECRHPAAGKRHPAVLSMSDSTSVCHATPVPVTERMDGDVK